MGIMNTILTIILTILIIVAGWLVYQNLPGEMINLNYETNAQKAASLINVSSEISQFYPNMRFNHNDISYFINPNCSSSKMTRVERAFSILEEETQILSFHTSNEGEAEILVACSPDEYEKEKNIFIAGEGGPTKTINTSMPVIVRGKVILYDQDNIHGDVECDYPVTELHEILHVFGFNHINDSAKIMYPYVECDQIIGKEFIDYLQELYLIDPFSELYFSKVNASVSGRYLNFEVSIENDGIITAKQITLKVISGGETIDTFELDDITFGGGQRFYVKNLLIPSKNFDKIRIEVSTRTLERDYQNNFVELSV